jgi:hypothetical protein
MLATAAGRVAALAARLAAAGAPATVAVVPAAPAAGGAPVDLESATAEELFAYINDGLGLSWADQGH